MKYDITYSCGHTETIQLFGRVRERERRILWLQEHGMCSECKNKAWQQERERKNAEAAQASAEMGLPDLLGTERQIAWAVTIRFEFVEHCEELKDKDNEYETIQHLFQTKTEASFWIDLRDEDIYEVLRIAKKEQNAEQTEELMRNGGMILNPPDKNHEGVATIKVINRKIECYYPKNDEFISVVKSLSYRFSKDPVCWMRRFDDADGSVVDRAAELGYKLLQHGFAVAIADAKIRELAVSGEFSEEITRKIGVYRDGFLLKWHKEKDDLYACAKRLPGAKWVCRIGMFVPSSSYKEVRDFADINDCFVSVEAKRLISEMKQREIDVILGTHTERISFGEDKLREILESSDEILPDLRDE